MELILFTAHFPTGTGEQFLESEIRYLSGAFRRITIIPLAKSGIPGSRSIPGNVTCSAPLLPVTLNKKLHIFFSALVAWQPLAMFMDEFIRYAVYIRMSWFMNWLSISSITRAAMKSRSYRDIDKIATPSTLFYFYWGDKSSTLCPFLKKRFPGNRFVTRFHGSDLYDIRTPGYIPYRKILLSNLDLAVFVSGNGKDFMVGRYPSVPFRPLVSRLGVSEHGDGVPSADKILRIVTCSNVVRIKQLHLLVEALRLIDFGAEWTHIGDGVLLDELKDLAAGLPVNVHASFPGLLDNRKVMEFYRQQAVDLFVNVSASEGIPVSIMEAISFGIPVIAPAVGGIPEIVTAEHGFLMPPDLNPREIAGTITRFYLLADDQKDAMRKAAKKFWSAHYNAKVNYPGFCEKIKSLYADDTE